MPNASLSLARSRRFCAKPSAPPMMKHTAERSSSRHLRNVAASAALSRLSPRSSRIDDDRLFRDDVGDGYRFLDATPFDVVGAALANFDDFDFANAEIAADPFRALAIGCGQFALGTLFQPADGGDQDTHGRPRFVMAAKTSVRRR